MERKTGLVLGIAISLMFISAGLVFSQAPTVEENITVQTPNESLNEPQIEWLWGEVVSLDAANKLLTVKYLDYETDQEKEINITVDEQTVYENAKSLEEIKPQDALSIDYIVSPEGKNLAKKISLEKPEPENITPQEEPAPQESAAQEPGATTDTEY